MDQQPVQRVALRLSLRSHGGFLRHRPPSIPPQLSPHRERSMTDDRRTGPTLRNAEPVGSWPYRGPASTLQSLGTSTLLPDRPHE